MSSSKENLKAQVLDPEAVDASVRPQDDFFRYVNGTWLAGHEIPSDRASDGAFYKLADLSEERTHEIAEQAVAGDIEGDEAKRIAVLYSQFMDEDTLNHLGAAPLAPLLESIQKAENHDDLAYVIGSLGRAGISGWFGMEVSTDLNDTDRYAVFVGQEGLGLPDESYYRGDEYQTYREKYVEHVAKILRLVGVTSADAAPAAAQDVMAFETALASHHWDIVKCRDIQASNNPRTWDQFVAEAPGFRWDRWAEGFGIDLSDKPLVSFMPDYMTAAATLWNDSDLHTLKFWLAREVADSYAPFLSDEIAEERFDFYGRTLSGIEEMRPRWKRALALVEDSVGFDMGRLYVERHFPAEYKERMDRLVQNLLNAYRSSITGLDWMGEETKKKALTKLDTFMPKIGYPEKWRDYSGLEVSEDKTLIENVLATEEFDLEWEFSKLGTEVDRTEWLMTPHTVNAYYQPTMNEIVFPAAILQPPFFNPEADDAVNYAGIGAVIGHEIGHGFDDQGAQFDEKGAVNDWWTEEDKKAFEKRTKALIAQYDRYSPKALDDSHRVNGALTIGENIGDLGGLTIAWKAWLKSLEEQGISDPDNAEVIDGLTGPERFFTSWASIWRSKYRDDMAIQLLAIDPHSPAEFRCNGILSNMDAFADYYDMTPEDSMWIAPEERVTIW